MRARYQLQPMNIFIHLGYREISVGRRKRKPHSLFVGLSSGSGICERTLWTFLKKLEFSYDSVLPQHAIYHQEHKPLP